MIGLQNVFNATRQRRIPFYSGKEDFHFLIGGVMKLSNAMKKGRLLAAQIAGEGFEPPAFGL